MYYKNHHASIVVGLTAQLWQLTQTNSEMEKVGASKPMTTEQQLCVLNAIPNWIKEQNCQRQNG
jgi:hypothetical protein